MNIRPIAARAAALLLLLSPAAGCFDDPTGPLSAASYDSTAAASVAAPPYAEIDLGSGTAMGINASGHVVGYRILADDREEAFLWTPAEGMRYLGTLRGLPNESSNANDIDDSGMVVGGSGATRSGTRSGSAFSWSAGEWRDLGTLPGTTDATALAVNNRGEIVGYARNWGDPRAFLYRPGIGMVALNTPWPGSPTSLAIDINDSSQILVHSTSWGGTGQTGFFIVKYPGEARLIGEGWETARAINNAGQVVGTHAGRGFVWDSAGGLRHLPVPAGTSYTSSAVDINDAGWIVGHVLQVLGPLHAALWIPDGSGGYGLTLLGRPGSVASAINTTGQVVGWAPIPVHFHAVLWSPTPPPAAPTNLAARAVSAGRVDLSWTDASDNETSFRVRRATRGNDGLFPPPYQTIATVAAGTTAFSDTAVVVGATYAYAVQACNASGCVYSTPVTVDVPQPPASPAGLSATVVSAGEIGLAWTDASTNEASFLVRRGTRGADGTYPPYQTLATLRRGSTGFADTTIAPGNGYRYQVQACNTTGCAASAAASVEVPLPPAAPTAVTAGVVAGKRVEVGWTDASADETGFRVRRSERRPDGTFAPFQTVGAVGAGVTAFTDATAAGGSTYRYLVQACVDAVCASSASVPVTVPGA